MASTPPSAARTPPSSATILQKLRELHDETRDAILSAAADPSLFVALSQAVKNIILPAAESLKDSASLLFDSLKSPITPEALAGWEKEVAKLENVIVPALESSLSRAHLRQLYENLSAALDTVRKAAHLDIDRVNPPSLDAKTPPHRLEKPALAALGV